MSEELEVLTIVTSRLSTAGIPYMITGSFAANFYTIPRMTRDIDVVVALREEDVDRVVRLFEADFYIDRESVQEAVKARGMFNLIHQVYVFKVDCIVRKDSEYRQTEFARRQPASHEGHQMYIVAPEDLILSKLDWARESRSEMQFTDVRNLLTSVPNLDHEYLQRWADRLGLAALYREISG